MLMAFLIALTGLLGTSLMKRKLPVPYARLQLEAAKRLENALVYLKKEVVRRNIPIEAEDINSTGLLGPEWTALTTSLGNPEAKRTALQPDWAALMVRYYQEAGLKAGDQIAAGFSGSFPVLCLAVICAANEMSMPIRVIPSIGASMHGATRPELDIVRTLMLVREAGIIDFELLAVSLGGDFDQGGGNALYSESRESLLAQARQSGAYLIDQHRLQDSVKERLRLYGPDIKCFVNVGGASANVGIGAAGVTFPNGLVWEVEKIPDYQERGLIFEYLKRGLPVIHLLNIRGLAERSGLPLDPVPLTKAGETEVYDEICYPRWLAASTAALVLGLLLWGARAVRKRLD